MGRSPAAGGLDRMGPDLPAAAAGATISAMAPRRQTFEPPHLALRRAIDAHAAIGAPPGSPEHAAHAREQEAAGKPGRPGRDYRRGSGGKFA